MKARALPAEAMCALEIVFMRKKKMKGSKTKVIESRSQGAFQPVVLTVWSEAQQGLTFVFIVH